MSDPAATSPPAGADGLAAFPDRLDRPARSILGRIGDLTFGRGDSAREVFLAWEALRFVYNAVLAFLAVALAAAFGVVTRYDFWDQSFAGAVLANVCFCIGPCAEGYLAMLRVDRRIARGLVFTAGLSLSSLVALVAVFAMAIPSF